MLFLEEKKRQKEYDGYVLKSSSIEQLIEAIRQVWQGERYLSPEVEAIIEQAQGHVVALTEVVSDYDGSVISCVIFISACPERSICITTRICLPQALRFSRKYRILLSTTLYLQFLLMCS